MKNALILGAAVLAGYALWLNYKGAKQAYTAKGTCTPSPSSAATLPLVAADPTVAATEIYPDVVLKKFDATPESTTMKTFARIEPIGAGCTDLVTTYDGTFIMSY